MKKTVIAAIIAVLLLAFVPLFALKDAEFGGSDDARSEEHTSELQSQR